jgi:phosphatidylinositol alpha-mannosyltransferase
VLIAVYIALVCPYDLRRPGGVRSHIEGLGHALVERGHRVDVIAPSDIATLGALPVVRCGRPRHMEFGGTQIDITWASWREVRAVADRGYDVMHFHTIWNPATSFELAAAFAGPKVATFHDVAGPHTPGFARALMAPASELIRSIWLDAVIAVSPVVSEYLAPGRHEIIPNGVSVPRELPPEGEREAVLCLGRLEPRKGVETLLDAAKLLGAACPPIWIAGDGPLRAELERKTRMLGLSRVSFLGEVSEDEKWKLLRRAALVVAPATGGESFGIVLLEAMAAGAPPIASDIAGYRFVLNDRAGDLLVPVGDSRALAHRITHFADPERRRAAQDWGLSRWRDFDWSVIAPRVEAIYRRLSSGN